MTSTMSILRTECENLVADARSLASLGMTALYVVELWRGWCR